MVLKFKIDLKGVGSLATENGLHVVGFYTNLVELKQAHISFSQAFSSTFYTDLVELKHLSFGEYVGALSCFIPT